VERCAVLLHLIDCTGDDPVAAYKTVRAELKAYSPILAKKSEIIAFNKIDALSADEVEKLATKFTAKTKKEPLLISAATQKNLDTVIYALYAKVTKSKTDARLPDPKGVTTEEWRP
jgi:GTP-binding protein